MKDIIIITGSELRHQFMREAIAKGDNINVLRTYCEGLEGSTLEKAKNEGSKVKLKHLESRHRSEQDFFYPFVSLVEDNSNPKNVPRGGINEKKAYEEIKSLNPDLIVTYGCSIIKDPLLSEFEGSFINVHLGLSPYYRGTGTNFWPLVNKEPEYVGATFMHLSEEIDAGDMIHQLRARIYPRDSPHQIGNRLIADVALTFIEIINKFDDLDTVDHPKDNFENSKYYKKSDYSEKATKRLYENFDSGLISEYLNEEERRKQKAPIAENSKINPSLEVKIWD